jgi:hypothetical protein
VHLSPQDWEVCANALYVERDPGQHGQAPSISARSFASWA